MYCILGEGIPGSLLQIMDHFSLPGVKPSPLQWVYFDLQKHYFQHHEALQGLLQVSENHEDLWVFLKPQKGQKKNHFKRN